MRTTFQVWAQGDRAVGGGTLSAKVEVDLGDDPKLIFLTKDALSDAFEMIWDIALRYVHVMTQEEYDEYTSDHNVSE